MTTELIVALLHDYCENQSLYTVNDVQSNWNWLFVILDNPCCVHR